MRGQATLQLVVSGSFCCHAVISSVEEDNDDYPSEYRGQHLGEVRGVKGKVMLKKVEKVK